MPVIDKPLHELLEYHSSNPKPADFNAFWDRGLTELKAIDPQIAYTEVAFQAPYAKCQSIHFTGTGDARVHAKLATPLKASAKPGPALVMFHGYSGASANWTDMLAYVAAGYTVAALDCRGQGGQSEDIVPTKGNTLHGHIIKGLDDAPEKMYYRNVFLDTARLAQIVMTMDTVDADRVGAMGGSQGGALALACGALEPRIQRIYSQYPFLSDYKRVWNMDLDQNAYVGLRDYFRRFDPLHQREDAIFEKLGYIDVSHLSARIQAEVLMGITLMDNICPPSTQFAAFNAIQSPKHKLIYPDFGHEALPGAPEASFKFMMGLASL
ncbi:alpha/beta fold hydrolase [Coraliomargarita sp. SDUM461003]|uniref:Alpha/beta fold hydrolase n=1 Tax=Thalassobacterium maritimum TaxID=3041265 RepID=A0ABU1AY66_9BACT|nr:alpha/beta fold hydrolase [Coraliomargarita sp. SDUM461003]MDQ8209113.1 alpha/beta fold hydrolase [Coraliomargarita sp. SDUM461003]